MGPVQARRDLARDRRGLLRVVGHAGRMHRHRERGQQLEVEHRSLDRNHSRHSHSRLGTGRAADYTVGVEEADQRGTGAGEEVAGAALRNLLDTPYARKCGGWYCPRVVVLSWWLSKAKLQIEGIVTGRMAAIMGTKASSEGCASVVAQ